MNGRLLWLIGMGIAANALLLWAVQALLRRRRRDLPAREEAALRGAQADARFLRMSRRLVLFALALWAVSAAAMYFLAKIGGQWWIARLPRADLTVPGATAALFQLVALFAGMALAAAAFGALVRRLWRDDGRFYLRYLSVRRYGCDYDRLCRGMAVPLFALAVGILALGSNSYVQARPTVLAVHPFLAIGERTYRYTDVARIETSEVLLARHTYGRDYWLTFRDGTVWDFYQELPSGGARTRARLAEVVARHAGVPIRSVPR